jgi:peptide/nickel transport system permease protein
MAGLRQIQQGGRNRITEEDMARIRSYFELDLKLPVRFSRWLIGQPRGPIIIGNYEFFGNYAIGCRKPVEATIRNERGEYEMRTVGCNEYVYLRDLEGRRTSRGVLFGDLGLSWRLLRDRPVTTLLLSRLEKTVELAGLSTLIASSNPILIAVLAV